MTWGANTDAVCKIGRCQVSDFKCQEDAENRGQEAVFFALSHLFADARHLTSATYFELKT